ncbi:MAG: tRNA (adenosine(37)-N6)-threonylcarbamoyltransferase complex dimerization subunit type 1 TsaB, partial [Lautropia sp.]
PGAFTALRVAAGIVQGLALTLSKPVASICSLAAMVAQDPAWQLPVAASGAAPGTAPADQSPGASWLQFSAIDARMGEFYFAVHECRPGSQPLAVRPPAVGKPADVVSAFDQVLTRHGMKDAGIISAAAGNAFQLSPILARWAHETGLDPTVAAARSPTAAAVLAVAASAGAPAGGPARQALPVYVRDKIALDVVEQRAQASART